MISDLVEVVMFAQWVLEQALAHDPTIAWGCVWVLLQPKNVRPGRHRAPPMPSGGMSAVRADGRRYRQIDGCS